MPSGALSKTCEFKLSARWARSRSVMSMEIPTNSTRSPRGTQDRMAHGVNMFDGAVWMNSPAIHLEIRSFADFALDGRHRPVSVVRMDAPHPVIPRRHSRCGIEAKQAVVFFGRMDDTSARDVDCPAAGGLILGRPPNKPRSVAGLVRRACGLQSRLPFRTSNDLSQFVAQRRALNQGTSDTHHWQLFVSALHSRMVGHSPAMRAISPYVCQRRRDEAASHPQPAASSAVIPVYSDQR